MMDEFIYFVYDGGDLLAGFAMFVTAVNFAESWRTNSDMPVMLVYSRTGEVIDTYVNDHWENGDY